MLGSTWAICWRGSSQTEAAIAEYRTALKISPNDPEIQKRLDGAGASIWTLTAGPTKDLLGSMPMFLTNQSPPGLPRWLPWAVAAGLLVAIGLVYGQTLWFGFLTYDDDKLVYATPWVQKGLTTEGLRQAFVSGPMGEWYPLAMISHMLDCQLFGQKAWGHHLVNLLLHAATTIGLLFVLKNMTGELWPSALVAAVFAVHPQHVESVAWIAERRDVLGGVFFVLTLAAYTGYVRGGRTLGRYLLVVLALALALMSKATLVPVPCLLVLLDYWPLGRFGDASRRVPSSTALTHQVGYDPDLVRPGRTLRDIPVQGFLWLVVEKLPLLALAVIDCVLTVATHQGEVTAGHSLAERMAGAVVAPVIYLRHAFCPIGLSAFYGYPTEGYPTWQVAGSCVLLAAVSVGVLILRRACPYLLVGWFWFLGMLVPVSGLLTISSHAMADRYMYLPQIGLAIAVSWSVTRLAMRSVDGRWALAGCSGLALVALTAAAMLQTAYWHDDLALWTRARQVSGESYNVERALANALNHAQKRKAAIAHYRRAAKYYVDPGLLNNLGVALAAEGELLDSEAQFRAVLAYDPALGRGALQLGHGARSRNADRRCRPPVSDRDRAGAVDGRVLSATGRPVDSAWAHCRGGADSAACGRCGCALARCPHEPGSGAGRQRRRDRRGRRIPADFEDRPG